MPDEPSISIPQARMSKAMAKKNFEGETDQTYLGDGVYASFDGYQVWLRTQRGEAWHEIALEPPVLHLLQRYAERLTGKRLTP